MRLICLAVFVLLCAFAAVSIRAHAEPATPDMLIDAGAQSQPAYRLFTPCPVKRQNVPFLGERTA